MASGAASERAAPPFEAANEMDALCKGNLRRGGAFGSLPALCQSVPASVIVIRHSSF